MSNSDLTLQIPAELIQIWQNLDEIKANVEGRTVFSPKVEESKNKELVQRLGIVGVSCGDGGMSYSCLLADT